MHDKIVDLLPLLPKNLAESSRVRLLVLLTAIQSHQKWWNPFIKLESTRLLGDLSRLAEIADGKSGPNGMANWAPHSKELRAYIRQCGKDETTLIALNSTREAQLWALAIVHFARAQASEVGNRWRTSTLLSILAMTVALTVGLVKLLP